MIKNKLEKILLFVDKNIWKIWLTVVALMFIASFALNNAHAFSIKCSFGAKCLKSQGTKIPANEAIRLLELCDEFTEDDIGRYLFPEKSFDEILDISEKMGKKRGSALKSAHFIFYEDILSSPLEFERRSNYEIKDYSEVKKSCSRLNRDFHNKGKWIK